MFIRSGYRALRVPYRKSEGCLVDGRVLIRIPTRCQWRPARPASGSMAHQLNASDGPTRTDVTPWYSHKWPSALSSFTQRYKLAPTPYSHRRYIMSASVMGELSFHRYRILAFENTIQTLYATSTVFFNATGVVTVPTCCATFHGASKRRAQIIKKSTTLPLDVSPSVNLTTGR